MTRSHHMLRPHYFNWLIGANHISTCASYNCAHKVIASHGNESYSNTDVTGSDVSSCTSGDRVDERTSCISTVSITLSN